MGACQSKKTNLYEKPDASVAKNDRYLTKQYEDNLQFLQQVPLFSRLPASDQPIVALALISKTYNAGDNVIVEGEQGDEFFIVYSGECVVLKNGKEVAKLKPGDYFGEASLLEAAPRNATIMVAKDAPHPLQTLSITREKFEDLGVRERLRFPRRRAFAGENEQQENEANQGKNGLNDTEDATKDYAKTEEERTLIRSALNRNKYLNAIMSAEQIEDMLKVAYKTVVSEGTTIIEEHSLVADRFYIISSGSFTVRKSVSRATTEDKRQIAEHCKKDLGNAVSMEEAVLTELSAGQTFGELALLYNAPRAATVEASSDSHLFVIDRLDFKKILRKQAEKRLHLYQSLIQNIEIFQSLLREEVEALVECFIELHYTKGQVIMSEGTQNAKTFYVLFKGTVSVEKNGAKVTSLTADPSSKTCPYFGEMALLNDEPRNATIFVESNTAALLVLDRSTFESILGPLKDIMNAEAAKSRKSKLVIAGGREGQIDRHMKQIAANNPQENLNFKKPKFEDLKILGLLGSGGFGAVRLVKDKATRKTFAFKQISKGYVQKMSLTDQIVNERKILSMTSSPFITQFFCSYNSSNNIYFLLECCLGGEIFAVYNRRKLHGSMTHCQFYTASVVCAFEHLHERRIIYRDLKPENMLLDEKGYCKLTDMGLAKFVIGRTYTTCGTPDYFAPEIIQACGHTQSVDWWCFGILVYELICGHPPFEGLEPMSRYKKIINGFSGPGASVRFPSHKFTNDASIDLIKEVCNKEPNFGPSKGVSSRPLKGS